MNLSTDELKKELKKNVRNEQWFQVLAIAALVFALGTLAVLIVDAIIDGIGAIDWQFITSFPSRKPEQAGILSALVGSFYLVILTALFSVPIGVATAVYLEEYATKNDWLAKVIEINISNLAGVPSIIYGLLGLGVFVRLFQLGQSLLAGSLTMSLLVLPIVIIASREAIRTVPNSIKEASFALGATKWETVWYQVLPLAFPGILTGAILAISRAIGEAAPLITIGALTYIAFLPDGILAPFTALPIQIFNWVSRPQKGFATCAAGGILILLMMLLCLNSIAIYLRQRFQRKAAY